MFDSTLYEVPDSRNVFLSPVYIATVLICAAVNWVFFGFAYILIVTFVAFDQVLLVWHVVCPASINVSPVVVLVTVRVNFPYFHVLQQAHLLSARQGQNLGLEH